MALLDIVLYPDDPLTQVAEEITDFGPELSALVQDMYETMDTYEGCGLAAPQIGLSKRLFVLRHPKTNEKMCFVNPVLSEAAGSETAEEGCLSVPHVFAHVARATSIRVHALDDNGIESDFVAEDWLARIIQHETDHLNSTIFLERLDILSREDKMHEWEEVRKLMQETAERQHQAQ